MRRLLSLSFAVALTATSAMSLSGCGQAEPDAATASTETASHEGHDHEEGEEHAGHEHDGWWCAEHGVPEEECTRCDASLIAAYKEKGDWCEEHDRPESQCFICNPKRQEKFVARYVAKYGEEPPKVDE